MRISTVLLAFSMMLTSAANAVTVVVNDGDWINFDPFITYSFVGELSNSNRMLTYGIKVDPGEYFQMTVHAPVEFDIEAVQSTGPNGTGTVIINPGDFTIKAGALFTFPVSYQYFPGQINWISMYANDYALEVINTVYGGSISFGSLPDGTVGIPAIPEPSSYLLMLSGLALVGFVAKRRQSMTHG